MKSRLTLWCEGVLEAAWLIAMVAMPLFFDIHSDRVFEPDKLTLLRSLALLMIAVFGYRALRRYAPWRDRDWLRWRSDHSIWRMPFILPVVAVVVIYLLSTLFSVTPRISWAGSYQRLQGHLHDVILRHGLCHYGCYHSLAGSGAAVWSIRSSS